MLLHFRKIKNDRTGVRFKNEHIRSRLHGRTVWGRVLSLGLAIISGLIGVVLLFMPGPAFVFFILSAALLASQWWTLACWLDRFEIRLKRSWKKASNLCKSLFSKEKGNR